MYTITPEGNHSIAVVKGHESYEIISRAFSAPFHEIDTLLDHSFIQVGESRYMYLIEVFFGGNMKVQFGINTCISNIASLGYQFLCSQFLQMVLGLHV